MIHSTVFNPTNKPNINETIEIVDFLFEHLEKYGDSKEDILKAIEYALKETPSFGGFVILAHLNKEVLGCVVVNQTGMSDYIPENILVYIATHKSYRGKGVGKFLMNEVLSHANGNIALHVEPDNPARALYEKFGFSSKYIEMRNTHSKKEI